MVISLALGSFQTELPG